MLAPREDAMYIDGAWAPASGESLSIVSPSTEEVVAVITAASPDDVETAVRAARSAFDDGAWPRMPLTERIAAVQRLRALMANDIEMLARLITDHMGSPIAQSRALQVGGALQIIDTCIEVATDYSFSEVRSSGAHAALVTREPVGVVAAITPWNVPLGIPLQKIVPALLAGCSIILKPAPQTALVAYALAEMVHRAGFPPGVFNVVATDNRTAEHLVRHRGIDKLTFTGSTGVGRRIATLCGGDLRRLTLELGGKSAAIFLEDADLDSAVEALRLGSFRNNGQICTLKTRLLVPPGRRSELVERLESLVSSMPVGDPGDQATQIGPVVSARQRDVVEGYIASGVAEGARLVVGGRRPESVSTGWFVEPTVFDGVSNEMTIAREEIFGPVVAVLECKDEEDAIAIANDSDYGISGAVFSADPYRALSVAKRLRTGVVEINGNATGLRAPFGGFKASGIGREHGREGLEAYTEARSIGIPLDLADALA